MEAILSRFHLLRRCQLLKRSTNLSKYPPVFTIPTNNLCHNHKVSTFSPLGLNTQGSSRSTKLRILKLRILLLQSETIGGGAFPPSRCKPEGSSWSTKLRILKLRMLLLQSETIGFNGGGAFPPSRCKPESIVVKNQEIITRPQPHFPATGFNGGAAVPPFGCKPESIVAEDQEIIARIMQSFRATEARAKKNDKRSSLLFNLYCYEEGRFKVRCWVLHPCLQNCIYCARNSKATPKKISCEIAVLFDEANIQANTIAAWQIVPLDGCHEIAPTTGIQLVKEEYAKSLMSYINGR